MNTLSNETVQAWIEEENYASAPVRGKRIVELGTELLRARRDLADIARGLQEASKSLDELKELL